MRTLFRWLLILICGWSCVDAVGQDTSSGSPSAEALRQGFFEAMQAGDGDRARSFVRWEDADAEIGALIMYELEDLIEVGVTSVSIEPLPDAYRQERIIHGIRYVPNVKVEGQLMITGVEDDFQSTLYFGTDHLGEYYIASIRVEQMDYDGPPDVALAIAVFGMIEPDPASFRVEYTYMVSGLEQSDSFEAVGNHMVAFPGQHILTCIVQKQDDFGWIKLVISEAGTDIFDSGRVRDAGSIVYRRDES